MDKIVRVITLYQPYATLLAYGIKKNETRPGPTSHTFEKGTYLIHAAKKWTKEQNDICLTEPFFSYLEKLYPKNCELQGQYASILGKETFDIMLPIGQIVGSFEVAECVKVDSVFKKSEYIYKAFAVEAWNQNRSMNPINRYDKYRFTEPEINFGDYSIGRSIWIGQNHKVLQDPFPYKGQQGYYNFFKGDINQLKFKE